MTQQFGENKFMIPDSSQSSYLRAKDSLYQKDLDAGKIERSNLGANIEFLTEAGVLEHDQKILEIGCGAGSMTAYLTAHGYDLMGTDVSPVLLAYAEQNHPGCNFSKMYGEDLLFGDESFDTVLSFDVLEHIPNVGRHLAEVRRVLAPGGYYLFQTPNKWTNLPYCILKDKSFTQWQQYHPSLQTRKSLIRLMNHYGFDVKIVRIKTFNEFFRRSLVFPFNRINFDKLPIQTNLYVIATKQS